MNDDAIHSQISASSSNKEISHLLIMGDFYYYPNINYRAGLSQLAALFQLSSTPLFLLSAPLLPFRSSPLLLSPSPPRSGPLKTIYGSGIEGATPKFLGGSNPSLHLVFPPIYLFFPFPFSPLPSRRSRPLKYSYGSGELCKLIQWDLGRSPSGKRIWCILALNLTSGGTSLQHVSIV